MKRAVTAFLLSFFTLLGGHVYNRRWATVALCAVAFAFLLIHVPLVCADRFVSDVRYINYDDALEWLSGFHQNLDLVVWALIGFWIFNALVAGWDGFQQLPDKGASPSKVMKWTAGLAMSMAGFLMLLSVPFVWKVVGLPEKVPEPQFRVTTASPARHQPPSPVIVDEAPPLPPEPIVSDGYGRYLSSSDFNPWSRVEGVITCTMDTVEAGTATIRGTVYRDNEPLTGLRLRMFLESYVGSTSTMRGMLVIVENDTEDYASPWMITDSHGYYSFSLKPGWYRLNGMQIDDESGRRLLSGRIRVPQSLSDSQIDWLSHSSVKGDRITTGPTFRFVAPIERIRPEKDDVVGADLVFEWSESPDTAYYRLRLINHGLRGGRGRKAFSFVHPRLQGTTATVGQAGYSLIAGFYYSWEVEAYDANDQLISRTRNVDHYLFKARDAATTGT